jgi:hypothetical protein
MSPSLDDSEVLDMMNTAKQNLIQFHTKKPRRKASKIKEQIAKMRPLIKEASVEQKYKMLKLLKEFHYRTVEPSEFNAFIENDEGMAEGRKPFRDLKSWADHAKSQGLKVSPSNHIDWTHDATDKEGKVRGRFVTTHVPQNSRGFIHQQGVAEKMKMGATIEPMEEDDVIPHMVKDLTGDGAPIAKLRAARDREQMKKRERSDGLPVEPKFDYLDEK